MRAKRWPGRRAVLAGLSVTALVASVFVAVSGTSVSRADEPVRAADGPVRSEAVIRAELTRLVEDVPGADGFRYDVRDSAGTPMHTAKVIGNPAGGYLAVYHANFTVKLATSVDLAHWTFRTNLDRRGSQPTIMGTSDGGFVLAHEANEGKGGHIRVVYYRDVRSLLANRAAKAFSAPRTLSKCNEGTPNIYSVRLSPDIAHSVIQLGMHFHQNCDTDREAVAVLENFTRWKASVQQRENLALLTAAALHGKKVGGNIGDRDTITFDDRRYSINEVQYVKNNFGTWQPYLYDDGTDRADPLTIRTHLGSRAFANPTFTHITAPTGEPAIVVTMFVPGEGSKPGESGELIYYTKLR
jgi:hypothetical protein